MSGAWRSGIITVLEKSFSTTPAMIPPAIRSAQLFGRRNPRSPHRTPVHHAHNRTSGPPMRGPKAYVTPSTKRTSRTPTTPRPLRAALTRPTRDLTGGSSGTTGVLTGMLDKTTSTAKRFQKSLVSAPSTHHEVLQNYIYNCIMPVSYTHLTLPTSDLV